MTTIHTGMLFHNGYYSDEARWVKAQAYEQLEKVLAVHKGISDGKSIVIQQLENDVITLKETIARMEFESKHNGFEG